MVRDDLLWLAILWSVMVRDGQLWLEMICYG